MKRKVAVARVAAVVSSVTLATLYILFRGGGLLPGSKTLASDQPAQQAAPTTQQQVLIYGSKSGRIVESRDTALYDNQPAPQAVTPPTTQEMMLMSSSKSAAIVRPSDIRKPVNSSAPSAFTLIAPATQPTSQPATRPSNTRSIQP